MATDLIQVARPIITDRDLLAVRDALASGRLAAGPLADQFATRFAQEIAGVNYGAAVSNGTMALELALRAVGVGPGQRVGVPSLGFFATAEAVHNVGAEICWLDVDDRGCLDPEDLDRHWGALAAVIPVHYMGFMVDMPAVLAVVGDEFPVIEDACQGHGASLGEVPAGAWGRCACFSFYATKHITTAEGGAVVSDDAEIIETVKTIANHGMADRDRHQVWGTNARMSELHAALGLSQLDHFPADHADRCQYVRYIQERIDPARRVRLLDSEDPAWFWNAVRFGSKEDAQAFTDHARQRGIETRYRYAQPLWMQVDIEATTALYAQRAAQIAGTFVGLPNRPDLTVAEVGRIIEAVNTFRG